MKRLAILSLVVAILVSGCTFEFSVGSQKDRDAEKKTESSISSSMSETETKNDATSSISEAPKSNGDKQSESKSDTTVNRNDAVESSSLIEYEQKDNFLDIDKGIIEKLGKIDGFTMMVVDPRLEDKEKTAKAGINFNKTPKQLVIIAYGAEKPSKDMNEAMQDGKMVVEGYADLGNDIEVSVIKTTEKYTDMNFEETALGMLSVLFETKEPTKDQINAGIEAVRDIMQLLDYQYGTTEDLVQSARIFCPTYY